MSFSRSKNLLTGAVFLGALALLSQVASAVVAPSTFSSAIQVQGEDPGTEFDDWAGIPIAITDPADNAGGLDINTVQIANDNDHIYIRATLHTTSAVSLVNFSLAFDTDQDLATGFDLFGLGVVGSEHGYQSDFPYQQATDVFNTGVEGVSDFGGDFIGLGVTFPFFDGGPPAGTQMEWAIPRSLAAGPTLPGTPVFTGDSFDFTLWTDEGLGDITAESISYTLATAPVTGGDFDGDLDVDGADFLKWQRDLGDATSLAEWQTGYGPGASTSLSAVPEPTSLLLASFGLTALALRRRRA